MSRSGRRHRVVGIVGALAVVLAACSNGLPEGRPIDRTSVVDTTPPGSTGADPAPSDTAGGGVATSVDERPPDSAASEAIDTGPADATVHLDGASQPIHREVLGTNLPAWLGPDTLRDPTFLDRVVESGTTMVRMPGGSWSNGYEWSACETGAAACFWPWAARPSDFAGFLESTGLPGMWTVSINVTAENSAAAVAFFNGSVDDERDIGVDRDGVEWGTVGSWAALRAEGGHPEPVEIGWWEIGNEVYGGRPDTGGDECASFGWEEVWTCDGTEYVLGDDDHDGFLTIAAAMRDVDPDIRIGAVGVGRPGDWSDWGNEVIAAAREDMDFYSVHQYGFDQSPAGDEAVARAGELWPDLIEAARSSLPADVPVGVTEYNLVSFESADTDRMMTRAANALYIADTIGHMIVGGVEIANQWNVANGITPSGTDYGMIDLRDGSTFPQFEAMRTWSQVGDKLLEVERSPELDDAVRIYATRREESLVLVVINLGVGSGELHLDIDGEGDLDLDSATFSAVRAEQLESDDMVTDPTVEIEVGNGRVGPVALPPWSLGLIEVEIRG